MYTFPQLLKEIRKASGLTQGEFSRAVGVSAILISMIEAEQKEVSKSFILKLAHALDVHPNSITPFLFGDKKVKQLSKIESNLIAFGEKLQMFLIKEKSKKLRSRVKK